jgi:small subunit ribosomal protein S1
VEDARTVLSIGDEIEARFVSIDRKNRLVSLSVKAKEAHEEAEAMQNYKSDSNAPSSGTTLGDLLKEKMGGDSN